MDEESKKILLVEDEKSIRDAVQAYLEHEKYEVSPAEDGVVALEKFEKEGRNFYKEYMDYVPGEVVSTEEELLRVVHECEAYSEWMKEFKEKSFHYLDGQSTKRLLHKILS